MRVSCDDTMQVCIVSKEIGFDPVRTEFVKAKGFTLKSSFKDEAADAVASRVPSTPGPRGARSRSPVRASLPGSAQPLALQDRPAARKVYVKGLAYHVSYNKLWEDFAHAGAIESIDMPMRANGWNEGFAFVKYTAAESAQIALGWHGQQYSRFIEISKLDGGFAPAPPHILNTAPIGAKLCQKTCPIFTDLCFWRWP